MAKHLHVEIKTLKNSLLNLSSSVEDNFRDSITALLARDISLAKEVAERDEEIDRMEVELEEDCLKALALHQPVAIDLRLIVSILKINNDLERIGDLASNIAERAFFLSGKDELHIDFSFQKMSSHVMNMLRKSMDSMVNLNLSEAREVCAEDEIVDDLHRECMKLIAEAIGNNVSNAESYLAYISVSRYLERIADHATNIAEDVIYMLDGEVVRHRVEV